MTGPVPFAHMSDLPQFPGPGSSGLESTGPRRGGWSLEPAGQL